MKLTATLALLSVLAIADPSEPAPTCDGVAKPEPVIDVVPDPAPTVYRGPYCAPGETCDDYVDVPGSTTYTEVGEHRPVLVNGEWQIEQQEMLPAPPPACWAWQWRDAP
jgi:hypothetical protein